MSLRRMNHRKIKRAAQIMTFVAVSLGVLNAGHLAQAEDLASKSVCVVTINEEITRNTLYLVRRGLREAEGKKAVAVVLDMNTNGGELVATEEIVKLLGHATIPTYTFVNNKAFSAGAIIANATDRIFMAPGSVIGAATPIMVAPGQGIVELPTAEREKMNSATRALVRTTAQQKGHNPDVFEAMVDADRGLKIEDKEILPRGKLLTLTSEEAEKKYGKPAKPLLSAGTVNSVDELLEKVELKGVTTFTVSPTGFEQLARWITTISPLLILIGFLALYMEFSHPGVSLPGLAAVICFGVYFLGYFLAGLAGWEEVGLFAFGLILLAFEFFLFPGHFVSAALGTIAVLAALVLAMTGHLPGEPRLPSWPQLQIPLLKVLGGVIGSVVAGLALGRYLPQSTLYKRMELSAATNTAEGYSSSRGEAKSLLGATGIAETNLRPSGKGRFGEQLVDVVTEGDLIQKGASITITEVQGSRVVVKRVV